MSNLSIPLILLDEIALEGLEGITFESLWLRLEQRLEYYEEFQRFSGKSDVVPPKCLFTKESLQSEQFRNACLRIVLAEAKKKNVQLYQLSKSRPPITLFDRNQHYIEESGTIIYDEDQIPDNIYHPVVGVDRGPIRGSCRDFDTRENVTDSILQYQSEILPKNNKKKSAKKSVENPLKNYQDFCKLYDCRRIVIVGSAEQRARALFGENRWPEYMEFTIECYILMELIGRQRNYGVLNVGKEAINFDDDPKLKQSIYSFRAKILQEQLIIQLLVFYYNRKRKQCSNSLVLFLPRFRPININPIDYKAVQVAKIFCNESKSLLSLSSLKSYGDGSLFKDVSPKRIRYFLQRFSRIFKVFHQRNHLWVRYLKPLSFVPTVEDLYDLRSPPAYIGKNNSKHKTDGDGEDGEDELINEMEDEVMELDEEEDAEEEVVEEEEEETDKEIENIDGNFENDDETKEEFIEILAENVDGDVEINCDIDDDSWKVEDDIVEDGDVEMKLEDKEVVDSVYELPNFDIPELNVLDEDDDEDSDIEELDKFKYKPVVVLEEEEEEEDRKVPIDEIIKDENEDNFVPKLYSLDSIARSSELGNIPLEQISTDSSFSSLIDIEEFRRKLSLFDSAFFDRIYLLIDSAGEIGLTTEQIHQFADIPKIYVRNAMKVLVRKGLIGIRVIAKCRSQVFHHVANRYLSSSANQYKSSSKFLPNELNQTSSSTTSPLKLIKRSFKFSDILISRIELILDYLQRTRYIDNPILLRNYIAEKERDLPHRCDLRSVYRILKHLYDANFIRLYRYRLSYGLYYRNVLIVLCNHNVANNVPDSTPNTTTASVSAEIVTTITPDDSPIINHLLIKNKFQFFASLLVDLNSPDIEISLITDHFNSKRFMGNSMPNSNCNDSIVELIDSTNDFDVANDDNDDEIDAIDQDATNGGKILLTLDSQQSLLMSDLHLVYQPSLAKRFGCNQHRIESMFELYRFLFYLLVNDDDEEDENSAHEIQPPEWHKKVPKLVKFFPDRQCHPIDFLPYLPMVLIVKIFRIRFLIPGLEQLLRDPARQCEMFYEVDANVRRHLLYGRKAIGELIGHLQLMSYFGLITWINWNDRERFPERHLSFRLNTQVQLGSGGDHCKPKLYQFRSITTDFEPFVLDVYWHILDSECKVQCEIDNEEEEEESNGVPESNLTCPFDSRIKIHQISTVIAKRKLCKNEMIPSDDSSCSDDEDDSLVDDVEYKGEYNRNESKKKSGKRKRAILNNCADILKRDSKKAKTIDGATEKKPKKIKKKPNERKEKSGNLIFKGKTRKERSNKDVVDPVQSQPRKSHTGRRQERLVWTREEDHFLLKCRLASMLMDPASRTQLCVPRSVVRDLLHQCVGPKSFSKDSLAVARRIRKFKCKPKLKRLLRFCLHELDYIELDENSGETGENFTTPQFTNRLERNESENWIAQYKKVLQQILSHDFVCTEFFLDKSQIKQRRLMATAENITANKSRIPRNLPIAELLERFEIVNPYQQSVRCYFEQDPKNYYDIHSYVISNILMSSLLSVKFIEYYRQSPPITTTTTLTAQNSQLHWSRRLFLRTVYKSLKHFPEMVVRWILKRLNQFEIISHNKRHSSLGEGESNGRKPLNCYAYRITANFFNQLIASNVRFNRSGSTRSAWIDNDFLSDRTTSTSDLGKTATTIIKDTNSVFSALQFIECFTADILGISTSSTPPSSESPSNLNSELPSVQKLSSIKFDVKIPERFISKTSSKSDNQVQPQGGPGAKKLTSLSRILLMRRKNADGNHLEQDDEEEAAMTTTTTTQNGAQISSTNNPFHEEMNVNHCKVQIRRSGPEPAAQCLQDTEILNLIKFHLRVFDTSEEFPKHSSSTDNFKIFDFSEYKSLVREVPDRAIKTDLINEKNFTELIEFIRSKKELGAKMDKLLEFLGVEQRDLDDQGQRNEVEDVQDGPCLLYDDDDFDEDINPIPEILSQEDEEISAELAKPGIEDQVAHFLRFCESMKLIFCVGIMEPTWVHRESIHFWMVPSYENLDPQLAPKAIGCDELPTESSTAAESSGPSIPVNIRTISFLPKIWKLPNGQLNREVLFAYFNQIIGFLCFEKPKIEQSELLEHFRPLAPPVQLLELLEMLTEIGCLRKLLVRTPVADPYRPLCFDHYFMEPDELALEIQRLTRGQTKKQTFYEPTNDTYTRLAFLYRALEPGAPSGVATGASTSTTTISQ